MRRWKRNEAEKKGGKGTSKVGEGDEDEDRPAELLEHLPVEQDRKAIMGCLAAILNLMRSDETRLHANNDDNSPSDANTEATGDESGQEVIAIETQSRASVKKSSTVTSTRTEKRRESKADAAVVARHAKRREDFQKELLHMSADLLLLSEDHADTFLPTLEIATDDDENQVEEQELLLPFLESLSSEEAAFRCIVLLLFRFLLLSNSTAAEKKVAHESKTGLIIVGYDARVRRAFKYLAVSVLSYFASRRAGCIQQSTEMSSSDALRLKAIESHATRKFESLEDVVASRLLIVTKMLEDQQGKGKGAKISEQKREKTAGEKVMRGLKIGGAGVAAGTVFAITGGLAAPAIAAGIAAVAGTGLIATTAITILTIPAAATIFGVGGGSLVASKVSNRTKGLGDFEIRKETADDKEDIELSRTVCISGWLTDEHDFQRPFGVTPDSLDDKIELLARFCSVYSPFTVPTCPSILQKWQGKEDELWNVLRSGYGKDPDSLLPLTGPRQLAALSESESDMVDNVIETLGFPRPLEEDSHSLTGESTPNDNDRTTNIVSLLDDVLNGAENENSEKKKKNLSEERVRAYRAWDYHAEYGGEQYTVFWEKNLLLKLNDSAKDFKKDLAMNATEQVLKKTAFGALVAAVALPATLLNLSNIIDERWTLVSERADEAGATLAQSLLDNNAGHRPVSLVGYSFGARIIYACLKELARHQSIWEEMQSSKGTKEKPFFARSSKKEVQYAREPASIVEDVVLMGCPASVTDSSWAACRRVAAGRMINCYSTNDWMLALMYRIKNLTKIFSPPVGIIEVNVPGIESCDVSAFVNSHSEYCVAVREILDVVGYGQPRLT